MRSDWPGNVRDLELLVAQLVRDSHGYDVRLDQLPAQHRGRLGRTRLRQIDVAQRDAILEALHDAGGSKTQAADVLGIARSTLYRKIRQYHIEDDVTLGDAVPDSAKTTRLDEPNSNR
jgi:transcriptional regulator of acetoin/glycerol metabolism